MSIEPIDPAQFDKLVALGDLRQGERRLTIEGVRAAAEHEPHSLRLPENIYASVVAALNSKKHVIFTGPPGTAKTTLAQAVAEAAEAARLCGGYLPTTATADWTTYETIGGLRPTRENTLEFQEGHFLTAIRSDQWLLIDELNRSNFDRAFGQLFTLLSGQAVVLPYTRPGESGPLALVPEGKESPVQPADVLTVPKSWRIIATMNVFDKNLLFEMSYALMRRFAFIEVSAPPDNDFIALIREAAEQDAPAASVAESLMSLRNIKDKDIGPAVFMDIARYARERVKDRPPTSSELIFECFYSYLLPQFEGIDDEGGIQLRKRLNLLISGPEMRERVRKTLNTVLGLELPPPKAPEEADWDDADELDDGPPDEDVEVPV